MTLTAKQAEIARAIKSYRYILLYGGSRGGKTFATVAALVVMALGNAGSRHLIARRYATDVRSSIWKLTLVDVLRHLDLHVGEDYQKNEIDMELTFPNGAKIICAGLDDAQRVDKILGTEYSTIYINECQDVPWTAVKILRTRLSQKIMQNRFIADLNPGSSNHWSFKLWFDKVDPESGEPLQYQELYTSVQVSPYDNRDNLDQDYIKMELETKIGNDRRRFLLGEYTLTSDLNVFTPVNYFTMDQFKEWAASHGWGKVQVVGGLDLGYDDADALSFLAWVDGDPRTWLIYEHKGRRQNITDLAKVIHQAMEWVNETIGPRSMIIYTDTGGGGKKVASELMAMHNLPLTPAYKRDKAIGIDLLQDEVNQPGRLHLIKGGPFDLESSRVVWTRDPNGVILRVIDDGAYHPDSMDSILYPFRYLWAYGNQALKRE